MKKKGFNTAAPFILYNIYKNIYKCIKIFIQNVEYKNNSKKWNIFLNSLYSYIKK